VSSAGLIGSYLLLGIILRCIVVTPCNGDP
jgi:hypothetical protein